MEGLCVETNASLKQSRDEKGLCVHHMCIEKDFQNGKACVFTASACLKPSMGRLVRRTRLILDVLSKWKGLCVHGTNMLETLLRLKSFTTNASATWHEASIIWLSSVSRRDIAFRPQIEICCTSPFHRMNGGTQCNTNCENPTWCHIPNFFWERFDASGMRDWHMTAVNTIQCQHSPLLASRTRPSRFLVPFGIVCEASRACPWHCLRGAHVQPVGPGLLAFSCPLGTVCEAPTFSQWVPAFSLSHALLGIVCEASRTCPWHCLRGAHIQPVGPGQFCAAAGFLCCSTMSIKSHRWKWDDTVGKDNL